MAGEYPLRLYEGMPSVAWLQADSDRSVICPMHEIARQASAAGVAVYSFMFTMGDPTNQCPGQNTYMSSNGFTPPGGAARAEARILNASASSGGGGGSGGGVDADACSIKNTYSYHAAELPYVFGTRAGPPDWDAGNATVRCTMTKDQELLSDAVMHYWISFVRKGEPQPKWHGSENASAASFSIEPIAGSANSTTCSGFAPAGHLRWPRFEATGEHASAEMQLDIRSRVLYNTERRECKFWGAAL